MKKFPSRKGRQQWSLDQLEIDDEEIFGSSSSSIYLGTVKDTGTPIVLKAYRKNKLDALKRLHVSREVEIHRSLQHPNIINLFAAFEDDKHVYLVQEFASGGDLFQHVKSNEDAFIGNEKAAVCGVIQPVMEGLLYLHNRGILHRDIKPENILLTADGTIKIADFGLSLDICKERAHSRVGTPEYMAPEALMSKGGQAMGDKSSYTNKIDVWAVGVLAFELLEGVSLFSDDSIECVIDNVLHDKVQLPSSLTIEARSFIGAALCRDPAYRPNIKQLLQHPWILKHTRDVEDENVLSTPPSSPSYLSNAHSIECPVEDISRSDVEGEDEVRCSPHGLRTAPLRKERSRKAAAMTYASVDPEANVNGAILMPLDVASQQLPLSGPLIHALPQPPLTRGGGHFLREKAFAKLIASDYDGHCHSDTGLLLKRTSESEESSQSHQLPPSLPRPLESNGAPLRASLHHPTGHNHTSPLQYASYQQQAEMSGLFHLEPISPFNTPPQSRQLAIRQADPSLTNEEIPSQPPIRGLDSPLASTICPSRLHTASLKTAQDSPLSASCSPIRTDTAVVPRTAMPLEKLGLMSWGKRTGVQTGSSLAKSGKSFRDFFAGKDSQATKGVCANPEPAMSSTDVPKDKRNIISDELKDELEVSTQVDEAVSPQSGTEKSKHITTKLFSKLWGKDSGSLFGAKKSQQQKLVGISNTRPSTQGAQEITLEEFPTSSRSGRLPPMSSSSITTKTDKPMTGGMITSCRNGQLSEPTGMSLPILQVAPSGGKNKYE